MKGKGVPKVGLIVNPIAGIGGAKALKGSDGQLADRAICLGAKPSAVRRAATALQSLRGRFVESGAEPPEILTCFGTMGQTSLLISEYGNWHAVYSHESSKSAALDTEIAAGCIESLGAEMIIFAGGDGTLRDVQKGLRLDTPVLGIPCGVKMYSGVFIERPEILGAAFQEYVESGYATYSRAMLDYEAQDTPSGIRSFGQVRTPSVRSLQNSKEVIEEEEDYRGEIADYFVERMETSKHYIFGTGSTVKEIVRRLGKVTNFLGVDIFRGRTLLKEDATDSDINALFEKTAPEDIYIVVTPLGGNGFIFGRGNQQITSGALRKIPRENVIIVSPPGKLRSIDAVRTDTGDEELDRKFGGIVEVIKGYNIRALVKSNPEV